MISSPFSRYTASLQARVESSAIWVSLRDVLIKNWHLGFTAFGGPPVHFQILHKKFVDKHKWIDEQLYQELFALSQALPGPASTKMLFCINYIHGGFLAGFLAFALWCIPGALGMFGLSLGVARIGETLPAPVYALLSGLNAATVGIIALAAVQLGEKAITDKLTRLLVFLGGVAGMLYTALWYFPVLMCGAGIATLVWDYKWLQNTYKRTIRRHQRNRSEEEPNEAIDPPVQLGMSQSADLNDPGNAIHHRNVAAGEEDDIALANREPATITAVDSTNPILNVDSQRVVPPNIELKLISWKTGLYVLAGFIISFIAVMLTRSLLKSRPRGVSLFANLYLAGTIIFGGGPVVVPLLREYVVAEGWVSPRNFLLGLALIQSFPGPNFNFAVYLGSLATVGTSLSPASGAILGFIGIFAPGLIIVTAVMGLWKTLRSRRWLLSILRGVNAGAVGLVFTAVYKLWQIGFVDADHQSGSPLGRDPWWVAITATSFVGGAWFGLSAPFAILLGGVMGLTWYGVVKA
ncbi:hypothetical protein GLAREA_05827 [Glarea lozoyensis ATCC 20868]|uniref:Chromate transporter n=1 Tax=Glarea lozoyensis (strain ATCC 20868 / MF5171) TaxID=1116229 RepID=S3D4X3_GLAL2|nr:uncharacterized protein GLAREA_05827 [Glarea lozoyensis ATCC 20868]EPE32815.1 hypothetical protein GLAREA_05827 [Glarea lozoyensis ATCC 20868]